MFDSEQRFDMILLLYSNLVKFKKKFIKEMLLIEIIIIFNKSLSFFIKEGESMILLPKLDENPKNYYSITCLSGESTAIISESSHGKQKLFLEGNSL